MPNQYPASPMPSPPEQWLALDAKRIEARLAHTNWQVRVAERLDSSNSALVREARMRPEHFRHPVLLAVEEQTAGRGRQGRSWHSRSDASLTASFAWPMQRGLEAWSGLSLVCGLAVRAALQKHGASILLKWPNDLLAGGLHRGYKLGGILVEAVEVKNQSDLRSIAVIGVGINLTPEACSPIINTPGLQATDLQSAGAPQPLDRNDLLADLALALESSLRRFEQQGFAAFKLDWNAAHAYQDQAVHILEQGQLIEQGLARGVDADGQLLLDTATGLRSIRIGDVSLRLSSTEEPR